MKKDEKGHKKDGEPLDLAKISADRTLAEFLGRFDMDLEATPENVRMVREQVILYGKMADAVLGVTVVERGKRMIWLKVRLKHGEWLPLLEEMNLSPRTVQWWMAEARYLLDHGERRMIAAPQMRSFAHFAPDDPALDDPEFQKSLADPKAKIQSYADVVAELRRRNVQKAAWEKRDEAHQKEIDGLRREVDRLAKARDPDAVPDMNPIREAMVKAVLSAGRAVVVLREADTEDLVTELREGAAASLNSRLSTAAQDVANEIYKVFHKAFPGKPWKGPEPTDED